LHRALRISSGRLPIEGCFRVRRPGRGAWTSRPRAWARDGTHRRSPTTASTPRWCRASRPRTCGDRGRRRRPPAQAARRDRRPARRARDPRRGRPGPLDPPGLHPATAGGRAPAAHGHVRRPSRLHRPLGPARPGGDGRGPAVVPGRGRGRGGALRGPRGEAHGRRRAGLLRLAPGA
jgi:hypothetical protein